MLYITQYRSNCYTRYMKQYMNSSNNKLSANYEACPNSKDTQVLNMYNIFNLQKRHFE